MITSTVKIVDARPPKRRAFLGSWSIHSDGRWPHLVGRVHGHRRFTDGELITTSPVIRLDIPAGYAETLNTIYMLEDTRS